MSNFCFLVTQETRSLHLTLAFFLLWISWKIRMVSSWCFACLIVCSVFPFFQFGYVWKKQLPEVLYKKNVFQKLAKMTGKYLCWSLFFDRVTGLQHYLKKRLWYRYFPVIFTALLRMPFHRTFPCTCSIVSTWNTKFFAFLFLCCNFPDVYFLVSWLALLMFLSY